MNIEKWERSSNFSFGKNTKLCQGIRNFPHVDFDSSLRIIVSLEFILRIQIRGTKVVRTRVVSVYGECTND